MHVSSVCMCARVFVHGCMCEGGQRSKSDVVPQGAVHTALETVFFLADRWAPRDVRLPRTEKTRVSH